MGVLGNVYDTVAGAADNAVGPVDESIGRQFDDEPGGGFADVNEGEVTNFPGPADLIGWSPESHLRGSDQDHPADRGQPGTDPSGDLADSGNSNGDGNGNPGFNATQWILSNPGKVVFTVIILYALAVFGPMFDFLTEAIDEQ